MLLLILLLQIGYLIKSEETCLKCCSPLYEPFCASDGNTYPNRAACEAAGVTIVHEGECHDQDACWGPGHVQKWGNNPICASNGYTYNNVQEVRCLKRYQPNLEVVHPRGCHVSEVIRRLRGSQSRACSLVKSRYEWNPVCGVDNQTYCNPYALLCYKPDMNVLFMGECGNELLRRCAALAITPEGDNKKEIVCGSDGRTYSTLTRLECARLHDKYLYPIHEGGCDISKSGDDPCTRCSQAQIRPICATDGLTYVSPEALWCESKRRNHTAPLYFHDGPCFSKEDYGYPIIYQTATR